MKYEGKYSKCFLNMEFHFQRRKKCFQIRPFKLNYFLSIELPSPWKGLHGMGESVRERERVKKG